MSNCRPFFINHLKVAPHVASFIQAIELLPDGVQFISLPPVHSAADLSILEISTSSSSIFSFLKMKIFFLEKNKTEICWPTSLTGKNHPQRCKFGQKSQCGPLSFFFQLLLYWKCFLWDARASQQLEIFWPRPVRWWRHPVVSVGSRRSRLFFLKKKNIFFFTKYFLFTRKCEKCYFNSKCWQIVHFGTRGSFFKTKSFAALLISV